MVWMKRVEGWRKDTWVEDEQEMFFHFKKEKPAFTIGLNYGLYLRVECVGAIMTTETNLYKGTEEAFETFVKNDSHRHPISLERIESATSKEARGRRASVKKRRSVGEHKIELVE
jgi:hypothetical protein